MSDRDPTTTRRNFLKHLGAGAVLGGAAGAGASRVLSEEGEDAAEAAGPEGSRPETPAAPITASRVAADPTDVPPPIRRTSTKRHEVTFEAVDVTAEIEPGVTFDFMTFGGQIPGPLVRVRQGDTVRFTLENLPETRALHNVDFHAVYGTGGGSVATTAVPGQTNGMEFKAVYPGAYVYHCASPNLDYHISTGMFGMILVEPPEGLPEVDREFYLGQHEIYTRSAAGEEGHHRFDFDAMGREDPTYVLLNGAKNGLTADRHGAMAAETGETARVLFACGGPNLPSNFHPIGNVWKKAWRDGSLASAPQEFVQTMVVPPGSCGVFEMDFPVPGEVKLVDHALSRVARKGMLSVIEVDGPERPNIFNPDLPDDPPSRV